MGDHERMLKVHKAAKTTVPENWDKNTVLSWHPGAAKWFNENGASIDAANIYGN